MPTATDTTAGPLSLTMTELFWVSSAIIIHPLQNIGHITG